MNKVAKATISLMIVTILSKVLGFMRELVLASFYGTSIYSDAYLIALNIPTVIFAAIGTAISTTFIPIYYESDKIGGKVKCNKFTNNVLNIAFILSLILSVVGFIFTDQLVKLFAIGFEGDTLKLTIDFTRILIFGIIFTSISEVIKGYLNANNNFSIPGIMSGVPFNIMVIVAIILSAKINPYILPVGTLIAISSRFIFQIPFAYKYGYKYKSYINIKDEDIKKMKDEEIIEILKLSNKLGRTIKSLDDVSSAELMWCLNDLYSEKLTVDELEKLLNAEIITQYPKIKNKTERQ